VLDTFVYRAGDAVAASTVEAMGAASGLVLPVAVGVSMAWCAVGVALGKRHVRLTASGLEQETGDRQQATGNAGRR
jgi:hypothetical protein